MRVEINRFTLRVYGILTVDEKILLVEERINDFSFTKFPGGGLEFGEGIQDCLIREFKEETGIDIEVGKHVYTTDFFQQSAFRKTDQLIAVYYEVLPLSDPMKIRLDEFEIENEGRKEYLRFFWMNRTAITEDLLTFPIDKKMVSLIQSR